MKIVVVCPYPQDRAPSQRLKFEQYYDSWRAAGHDVVVRPFWDERAWAVLYAPGRRVRKALALVRGVARRIRGLGEAQNADLVYLHLEAMPLGPPWFERAVVKAGVPIVYDIDDLVYLPHSSRHNRFMRWLRRPEKVVQIVTMSAEVIVCTRHLEAFAREHNDQVTLISSTIDTDAYQPRSHSDRTNGLVVGWSGSHSTSPYLHLLDDVLRRLHADLGVAALVIGDQSFGITGMALEAIPWSLQSEVSDLARMDIGVYPLPDEEWVLGKSGLKALQYMALGIPTVAQRVGSNLEIIEHGRNGFLAGSEDEWYDAIRTLVESPSLRRSVGTAARQTVVERYSVATTAPVYLGVLERAIGEQT